MKHLRKTAPWLLGLLLASLLFALLAGYNTLSYSGTDDSPILRSFMGYEGGEPAHYSMLIHPVMAWLLWGLAKLTPGVAWFSLFQLFFLWFSSVVVIKSFTRGAMLARRPLWLGALLGVLTVGAGALYFSCRVSFTTTAAWMGAAAVAQLASVDWREGTHASIRRGMLLSVALLIGCYFLRQISVLPPLAFWLLGLVIVALTHRVEWKPSRNWKPLAQTVAVCAGCLLVLTGARFVETKALNLDEFYRWQDTSSQLLDYSDMENIVPTDAALEQIGWSREEYTLFTYWYFMDDNINSDTMTQLYHSTFETAGLSTQEHLKQAFATVSGALTQNPAQAWCFGLGLMASALCVLLAALRGFRKVWLWLGAIASSLLAVALLGYLGWEGRLPMRAMVSVTLPMTALSLWLLLQNLAPLPGAKIRNAISLLLCALLLYPGVWSTALAWKGAQPPAPSEDGEETPIVEDLDNYALDNPDTLFIYDLSLVCDDRMFPSTVNGVPGNVMFWGGHPARSISWYATLQKYGITTLNASLFTRDNVLMVSTDPEPWPSLMAYIGEETGESVDWEYVDTYGYLNFFRIYAT
ncbi:MAG TPA: hypothetical protein PKJ47_10645 [Candidatus Limiplasma sp.]|nr:hypothetical protein [Candidatus Limiplasma sp.]